MSDEPTIRNVLEAIKATETRLESRIDGLGAKIDGVESRLTQQIRNTEMRAEQRDRGCLLPARRADFRSGEARRRDRAALAALGLSANNGEATHDNQD